MEVETKRRPTRATKARQQPGPKQRRLRSTPEKSSPEKDPTLPTSERIYVAAARLFMEKGFDGTSMSEIAAEVGITKAGLYHFIDNKEDLLFTLMSFGMDTFSRQVVDPARQISDPLERIRVIVRNHLQNIGSPTSRRMMIVTIARETTALTEAHRNIINGRKAEYYRLIRDTLGELRERGDLQDGIDLAVAAHTIVGMIVWMPEWRRLDGRLSFDEVSEQITRFALSGLLKR